MITEENTIGIAIDQKTMKEFMTGKRNSITIDLNDDSAPNFIENIDGGYFLNVEELPNQYYGCYYYNKGIFPYVIKEKIEHLMLTDGKKTLLEKLSVAPLKLENASVLVKTLATQAFPTPKAIAAFGNLLID